MAITLSILDHLQNSFTAVRAVNLQQNPYWVTHRTLRMLLHYLGKLKIRNFALFMHVKHVSDVTFIIYRTDICQMS